MGTIFERLRINSLFVVYYALIKNESSSGSVIHKDVGQRNKSMEIQDIFTSFSRTFDLFYHVFNMETFPGCVETQIDQ